MNIDFVQNEILLCSQKIETLMQFVNLAIKKFDINNEYVPDFIPFNKKIDECGDKIPISFDEYHKTFINGRSIQDIEEELILLSTKVVSLFEELKSLCQNKGHSFQFLETKDVFNFDDLEINFEKRYVYCCSVCGESICLEENKNEQHSDNNMLDKLRKAREIQVYKSKFKIEDSLHR